MESDSRTEKRRDDHLCLKHWLLLARVTWSEISSLDAGIHPTMQERRDALEKARLCPRCRSSADAHVPGAETEPRAGSLMSSPASVWGQGRTSGDWSVPPPYPGFGDPPTHTRPRSGKGWVIGGVAVVAGVLALGMTPFAHAHRTRSVDARQATSVGAHQTTSVNAPQSKKVDVSQLRAGDCLPRGTPRLVTTVTVGPCSQPHREEVYAVFDLPHGNYPGQRSVNRRGYADCRKRFAAYVGIDYGVSLMGYYPLTPDVRGLPEYRTVTCVVVDIAPRIGTVRGSRR